MKSTFLKSVLGVGIAAGLAGGASRRRRKVSRVPRS